MGDRGQYGRRYRYNQPNARTPPYFLWFRPFADNEADQIRTYVVRDTYRQGALCPSI